MCFDAGLLQALATMVSLTRDELLAVLNAAKEHSERDWLLLLVTFSHGLRASEAVGLTKSHFRDGYLTVKRLKGSLKTVQPLLDHDLDLLNERAALTRYLDDLAPRQKLFTITRFGFDHIFKRRCEAAGIPRTSVTLMS
jgi:integrase